MRTFYLPAASGTTPLVIIEDFDDLLVVPQYPNAGNSQSFGLFADNSFSGNTPLGAQPREGHRLLFVDVNGVLDPTVPDQIRLYAATDIAFMVSGSAPMALGTPYVWNTQYGMVDMTFSARLRLWIITKP